MKTSLFISLLLCVSVSVFSQSATVMYSFSGDATDMSGNGNHGTLAPGTSAVNALKIGNNITNYLTVPAVALDGLTDFSIIFKIKFTGFHTTGTSPTNHIFSGSRPGSVQCFGFSYEKNANGWLIAINGSAHYWPDATVLTKKWYCMSLTRTGSTITLYKNGVSLGTYTNASTIDITSLVVGQEDDCVGGCFASNQSMWGHMDNFQIWDVEKTDCGFGINGAGLADNDDLRDEEFEQDGLIIYPNPASSKIYLDYFGENVSGISLIDLSGRTIYTSAVPVTEIDIAYLNKGIYLLVIKDATGNVIKTEKIVVQ